MDAKVSDPISVPLLIDGEWRPGTTTFESLDPYHGDVVSLAPETTPAELDDALDAARAAAPIVAAMPAYERAALLRRVADILATRADDIGLVMARETGKALKDARAEVRRCQDTVKLSAEEAIRIEGQHVPLDGSEMGAGKMAFLMRFPVGVVAAITPFNAPFNLAMHKIAPALAAGNAVVIKPPQQCPAVVHHLVEMFVEAGLAKGALNVLHGGPEVGRRLVADDRVDFISFTGSSRVGAEIRKNAGLRRVALELGGNGPTIVCADADIAAIAPQLARNAVRLAGQSCISVQNIFAPRAMAEELTAAIAAEMQTLVVGDPLDEATDIGTLIAEAAARRVEAWVNEAAAAGARVVTGGTRSGAQFTPTLMSDVSPEMKIVCDEVFGPVASVVAYDDVAEAIALVNDSPYGLQCGVFTDSTKMAMRAAREIRTGGAPGTTDFTYDAAGNITAVDDSVDGRADYVYDVDDRLISGAGALFDWDADGQLVRREDAWGGTAARRMRFLLEIVAAMRSAVGEDFPVGLKLNSADFQRGGFSEDESMAVVQAVAEAGVDLVEISGGSYEAPAMTGIRAKESTRKREAYFLEYAQRVRCVVDVPLVVTGGFRSAVGMAAAIEGGAIDLVGLARPLAVEPDLPARILAGEDFKSVVRPVRAGLQAIDKRGFLEVSWYNRQLARMAAGKPPLPTMGAWRSLLSTAVSGGRHGLSRRRA